MGLRTLRKITGKNIHELEVKYALTQMNVQEKMCSAYQTAKMYTDFLEGLNIFNIIKCDRNSKQLTSSNMGD